MASRATRGSYDDAFREGLKLRERRDLTPFERRLARLKFELRRITAVGQFTVNHGANEWLYGDYDTQEELLRYEGRKLWVGVEPLDYAQPAAAFCPDTGRCLVEKVAFSEPGRYGNRADAQRAAKQTREQKARLAQFDADMRELAAVELLDVPAPTDALAPAATNVARPDFNPPMKPHPTLTEPARVQSPEDAERDRRLFERARAGAAARL